jgi:hypothetical protein
MTAEVNVAVPPLTLDVELDFEFDKSEELCRAIEDAYEDVYAVLDLWKLEFQNEASISDRMYFSDFLQKRKEMCTDKNISPRTRINAPAFIDWLDSNASGGYTALTTEIPCESAAGPQEATKISLFGKVRQANDRSSAQPGAAATAFSVPARRGIAPSKLLQRLHVASSVLAFDYDNIFDTFTDGWHEKDADIQSEGTEPDIEELRSLHLLKLAEREQRAAGGEDEDEEKEVEEVDEEEEEEEEEEPVED